MEIIGISGKIGVGKDYIANLLNNLLPKKNTLFINFADHLKIDVCTKHNIDYKDVFHKKTNKSRKVLQETSEQIKENYDSFIWINALHNWMKIHNERNIQRFIIADVRFKREVAFIQNLGGKVIRIEAPKRNFIKLTEEDADNKIKTHISEIELDFFKDFDYIINNDFNDNLEQELKTIVKALSNSSTNN